MLYISDETMSAMCDISEERAGAIMQMVIKHHLNKEPIQITDDDGITLSAFIILQEHNKYFEKKKTISELRSKSRKGK